MINERVQIESTVSNCHLWHALASSGGKFHQFILWMGQRNPAPPWMVKTGAGFRWPIHRQELVIRQATGWCPAGQRIFIESGLYIFCWLVV